MTTETSIKLVIALVILAIAIYFQQRDYKINGVKNRKVKSTKKSKTAFILLIISTVIATHFTEDIISPLLAGLDPTTANILNILGIPAIIGLLYGGIYWLSYYIAKKREENTQPAE